jgi:catechol 2,3-dioxygenase-like lactoylglutathione lyase family enzyme
MPCSCATFSRGVIDAISCSTRDWVIVGSPWKVFDSVQKLTSKREFSGAAHATDRVVDGHPDAAPSGARRAEDGRWTPQGRSREVVMDQKLEVVVLPVADADRAKAFYGSLGWREDADFAAGPDFRVLQFTPPGSEASVIFGTGVTNAEPGSTEAIMLTVTDLDACLADLRGRGVEVDGPWHDAGGVFHHGGTAQRVRGRDPQNRPYCSFASFADPDGNTWVLQEITTRLPGRVVGPTRYADADDLAEALRRAAAAHGEHEKRTGAEDPDWPDWYARYLVAEQSGAEPPE